METNSSKTISVNGLNFTAKRFKPSELKESDINHVVELLRETGELAKDGSGYSNFLNSPLTVVQGLVRYQIERNKHFIDAGISNDDLETTSDFLNGNQARQLLEYQDDVSAMFLFEFLYQIVRLSQYPELIDEREIDLFAQNMRAFHLLTPNQINASKQRKDYAFEKFAYSVWLKLGAKDNLSAKAFYDYSVRYLQNNDRELAFSSEIESKKYEFVVKLTNDNKIATECVSIAKPRGFAKTRPKGLKQINNIWKEMKEKFTKRRLISG